MSSLTDKIRKTFGQFTDIRQGGANQQHDVSDAALSAFLVFSTQSPSFLDAQTRIEQSGGKSNAQTIFGVHKTPSDNQIRNLLALVSYLTFESWDHLMEFVLKTLSIKRFNAPKIRANL